MSRYAPGAGRCANDFRCPTRAVTSLTNQARFLRQRTPPWATLAPDGSRRAGEDCAQHSHPGRPRSRRGSDAIVLQVAWAQAPAGRTQLGRIPRIQGDNRPTSLCRFVGQNCQEGAPTLVVYILGQVAPRQASKVKSFHVDAIESPHQIAGQLKGVISPQAADPLVQPRNQQACLAAPVRTTNPPRNAPLRHPQAPPGGAQGARASHELAGGECCKGRNSQIQPYAFIGGRERRGLGPVKDKAYVPMARMTTHCNGSEVGVPWERPMPADLHVPDTCQSQASISEHPGVPAETVIAAARAEAWITRHIPGFFPTEEGAKGMVETAQWIAHRITTHPGWPHSVGADICQVPTLRHETDRWPSAAPRVAPLLQTRVVQLASKGKLRL
jgi:hypothetical protein